jgi:hypothetical protein
MEKFCMMFKLHFFKAQGPERPGEYLMVIGGCCVPSDLVELVSIDPEVPVPDCLENLGPFPKTNVAAAAATLLVDKGI